MDKWYRNRAESDDVVISSRVRLARNLKDVCFQERLSDSAAADLVEQMKSFVPELEAKEGQKFFTCSVNKQSELEKASMVEWHIISPELRKKKQSTGLILSEDEGISVMINEEDHLRIQTVCSGFDMKAVQKSANRIDDFFDSHVDYAFDGRYGYLTSCPTNVGTGLRASYMLFLPALTTAQLIEKLADEVGKYGIVIRGMYGEGTKSRGFLYQVSNQKTLGCTERDIVDSLSRVVLQIVDRERHYRMKMLETDRIGVEDKVYRSYGVLKYAKYLTSQDAMVLLAQLKLGVDMKLIEFKSAAASPLHELMMEIQSATIQKREGKTLGTDERRRLRAEYLNRMIPEI